MLQPDDRGTIGDHAVLRVLRQGAHAVHYTDQPLEEGSEVCLKVDWKRRFDHMQQHSGKHIPRYSVTSEAVNSLCIPVQTSVVGCVSMAGLMA